MKFKFKVLFSFFALILSVPAFTQQSGLSPVAVALSGGGARGAYQIGVWKALKDMNIEIGDVYGVSVGAVNGACMVMDDYELAEELWLSLKKTDVMEISEAGQRVLSGDFSLQDLTDLTSGYIESGGIDVSPLEQLLKENIDEQKIRAGSRDFGMIAFSLSEASEKIFHLDDIPEGQLADYILASANFPIFERKVIDGEEFIDGGVYRNIALNMIDSSKYTHAVLVSLDIYGIDDLRGYVTGYSGYELDVVIIRPRFNPGSVLDFSPENAARLMRMGYLDCMHAFGKLYGEKYYLYGESPIRRMFEELNSEEQLIAAELLETDDVSWSRFILPELQSAAPSEAILIEKYADRYRIERDRLYSAEELLRAAVDKYLRRSYVKLYYNRYLDFLSYLCLKTKPGQHFNELFTEQYNASYNAFNVSNNKE